MRPALFALAVVALAACGSKPKPSTTRPSAAQLLTSEQQRDCMLHQISLLDEEIRKLSRLADLAPRADCERPTHDLSEPPPCERCDVAEVICEDADDICHLAGGQLLADHGWAATKCRDARATCRSARAIAVHGCSPARDLIF